MSRPRRRTLNLLFAALVLLGGMPRLEWRHRHEGGGGPHRHARGGPTESHHQGSDPRTGSHSDHHGVAEVEGAEVAASPADEHPPSLGSERDWHVHRTWLGGLAGEDWRPPSGDDDSSIDGSSTAQVVVSRDQTSASSWPATLALLKSLRGPPSWDAAELPPARLLRAGPDRGPSPPLCDRARHERSGVQLT